MRSFLILPLALCCLISCGKAPQKKKHTFSEYSYPDDSLENPKLFVFEKVDSPGVLTRRSMASFNFDGKKHVIKYSLAKGDGNYDSTVYVLQDGHFELKESYLIARYSGEVKRSQGEIVLMDEDDPYHTKMIVKYPDPFQPYMSSTLTTISHFDNNISYDYKGQNIRAIRFIDTLNVEIYHSALNKKKQMQFTGETVFGLNIGVVYYVTRSSQDGWETSWQLDTIVDFK
jgi:hypothetical protein